MGTNQDAREVWGSEATEDPSQPLLSQAKEPGSKKEHIETPLHGEPIVGGPRVEYIYVPIYPRTGSRQDAVGVLGRTKRDTVALVQRGFNDLSGLESRRIGLQTVVGNGMDKRWANILDEAWDEVMKDPPKRLNIVVADSAEDKKARAEQDQKSQRTTICLILLAGAIFLVIIYFVISNEGGQYRRMPEKKSK